MKTWCRYGEGTGNKKRLDSGAHSYHDIVLNREKRQLKRKVRWYVLIIVLYLLAIIIANVATAAISPLHLGVFIVPAGTVIIGITFILRDLVQRRIGRGRTYAVIAAALFLSAASSYLLGDTLWIVLASAITFALSETTDTEIYTRLKLPLHWRVLNSGLIGGTLDSVVFVVIGLSPLGAGFLPWEAVPMAIIGQILVKALMQGCGAVVVKLALLQRESGQYHK